MKKLIILVGIITLFASCSSKKEKVKPKESFELSAQMQREIQLEKVSNQTLKNEMHFFGKIVADNNKLIEIYPVVGGSVTKVYVELGDYVHKGQLLATIKSTEVASFQKDLEDAKNDVIVSKNNYKVTKELFEGKINTERDVLESKSQWDKSEAQLARVKETFKIYNIKGSAIYEVRAPISGFIIDKNINQDMLLRNDRTDNIFDIAEIKEVWAIANVNESDINNVKLGYDAIVKTLSYPDKLFFGKVDKIFNIIDPDTKAMKVRVKLDNSQFLLKPEMRASITLSNKENKQMLAVPSSAIIFDKNKYFVMVYHSKNNIETKEIEVYRQLDDLTFIYSGIENGDQIIVKNQLLIYDALND
jgi:cobalt-zinc-cadmium efflux system membrane fusion protein